ncbi:MAG: peptide ABC transporter substrate-binding protein [Anaerolineae bacterium]|nr:peptide ABC transporter substrate-binding protein [Anaerolineae bacterium]
MKHRSSLKLLLVVALLALAFAGLGFPARAADSDTIIIGTTDKVDSLDNADAYTVITWEVFLNTGEGLLRYEPGTSNIVPGLATDMPKISSDGKVYTFTLRDGLKFADGTPLDAKVYVEGLKRIPALKGDVQALFTSYVDKVEAPDAKTIVFTLKDVYGFFNALIAGCPPYYPVNPKTYPADKLNQFPVTIDGIGPYRMTSFKQGEQMVLEANPNYYGAKPRTSRVIVRYFTKSDQMSAAVEKGEIDIAWRALNVNEVVHLKKLEGLSFLQAPVGGIRFLAFNHPTKPYDNPKVRAAIAAAIDRDEINDRVFNGLVLNLYSQVPADYPFATRPFKDLYGARDLDTAIKLFGEAGATADKPLQLELWYPPEHYGAIAADVVQLIKAQIEDTKLAKVELKAQEWATYAKASTAGQYGFFYLGWYPDYLDADNYLTPFADSEQGKGNGIYYNNPTMDKLLKQGTSTADLKAREDIYRQAQELYAKDTVTVPLFLEPEFIVWRAGVTGADQINPLLQLNYNVLTKAAN